MNAAAPPLVYGEPVETPSALYIPPEAMRVMLDNFSGPLDLLLYLVRKHRFDILDIPVCALCEQYSQYVEESLQREKNLETAADYLSMAALLVEIKSKMLLPKPPASEEEEEDPRADLVRRLLEYEKFREVARQIGAMPRRGRDFIPPNLGITWSAPEKQKPVLHPPQLAAALAAVLARARLISPYHIWQRNINLREIMSGILRALAVSRRRRFAELVAPKLPGASFLAVLQLAGENTVLLHQSAPNADLLVELREQHDGTAGG